MKIESCTEADLETVDEMISEGALINHHAGLRLRATITDLQAENKEIQAKIEELSNPNPMATRRRCDTHNVSMNVSVKECPACVLQAENERLRGVLTKIKELSSVGDHYLQGRLGGCRTLATEALSNDIQIDGDGEVVPSKTTGGASS